MKTWHCIHNRLVFQRGDMNGFYYCLDNTIMKFSWNMALIHSTRKETKNCSTGTTVSNNALEWTGGLNYFFKEDHSSKACQVRLFLHKLGGNLKTLKAIQVPNAEGLQHSYYFPYSLWIDNLQISQFHFKHCYSSLSSAIRSTNPACDGGVCQSCISAEQWETYSLILFVPHTWVL